MDIVTFRYLMSALLQVFGALVAVGAIFLVFQHDKMNVLLRARSDQVANELFEIEMRENFLYRMLSKYSIDNPTHIQYQLPLLSKEQVDDLITEIDGDLNQIIMNYQRKIESNAENKENIIQIMNDIKRRQSDLKDLYESFRRSLVDREKFISKAYRVMALPAISAIVYGSLLLFADSISSPSLVYWGSFSILLAFLTFTYTIYISVSSFR